MTGRRAALERRRRQSEIVRVLGIVVLGGFIVVQTVDFLTRVGYASTIAVGGLFIAYLVVPVVRKLAERMPRAVALAFVCVGVLAVLAVALYGILPSALNQLLALVHDLPGLDARATRILNDPHSPFIQHLPPLVREPLRSLPTVVANYVQQESVPLSMRAVSLVRSAVETAALVIAVPVVAIYMLAEAGTIEHALLDLLPPDKHDSARALFGELESVVGGFIRGQLVVAGVVGSLIALLLTLLGEPYAVLIGFGAGLLDIIPYVGAVAGYLPAAIIALIVNGPINALEVTAGFVAVNQLEGHIISPRIVSGTVGVTPLAVIFALLVGGELYGLPGLIVAVPVAGVARVIFDAVRFRGVSAPAPAGPDTSRRSPAGSRSSVASSH